MHPETIGINETFRILHLIFNLISVIYAFAIARIFVTQGMETIKSRLSLKYEEVKRSFSILALAFLFLMAVHIMEYLFGEYTLTVFIFHLLESLFFFLFVFSLYSSLKE